MKRAQWTLLALALVCVISIPAAADTIYNNFDTGNSYDCCNGWTVSGPGSPPGQFISANEFTAGATAFVSQIDIAIGKVVGDGGGTASLYTVGSGGVPGTLLGSWDFVAHQTFGDCCAFETISISGGPMLTQSTDYFMVLSADNTSWDAWNQNTTGATGNVLYSTDNGNSWNSNGVATLGTFRIEGTAVPEPGTLVMLGSGVLAAGAGLRRKFNV
jgi:hypothetical protein